MCASSTRKPGEILTEGEIGDVQLRGPNVFKGYWRQPDKTSASFSADGWFKTRDLGFREKGGYITLCRRSKDLISSGRLNISARGGTRFG
jgi:malonyl-CoA/methylmalonyl-CoA synthetase